MTRWPNLFIGGVWLIGAAFVLLLAARTDPGPLLSAPQVERTPEPPSELSFASPTRLRIAVIGEPSVDPAEASVVSPTDMISLDLLYDGLTSWDVDTGTWRPAIAESLSASADGLVWRVELGPHAFSDGSQVTAADVKRSLERLLVDPSSVAAARLDMVADIVVVDAATLEIVLDAPFAPLPALLSSPVYGVVPDAGLDGSVGSGPMLADGDERVAERVDERVEVQLVTVADADAAVDAYHNGEVELTFVPPAFEGEVDVSVTSAVESHYAFNVTAFDVIDPAVRRAIVGAIDPAPIAEAGYGAGAVPFQRTGVREPAYPLAGLSIAFVDDDGGAEAAMAAELASQIGLLGGSAVPAASDIESFVELVGAGEHELVRSGWIGLFPWPQGRLTSFTSDSPDNVTGYANDAFDAALGAALATDDLAAYEAAAAILDADGVLLPVATLEIRALLHSRVRGVDLRHDGTFDLSGVVLGEAA